ncbi:NAD(P)/FAD-dependent oxidoreductase [Microbacterium invictum]|uniref:Glycine/D-amino acid oxidase-like deaminating enzyme n=1 Tax=Microbacterium invictum TaxID=515415 RepID=A0AA40SPD7_9MICO|nr:MULTISPECIES: FAD-dependent oxidoreductase [Microbacterium]MBB4139972.1 glycine/D-amino acid oxidase-like deaminating enzyme [Microbacterium invictum]
MSSQATDDRTRGYDVIVVGAGIVGAACARALAQTGRTVAIVDRADAVSGTSSHGEGNLLVSDKGPGPELVLAQHARRRWATLSAELRDESGPDFPGIEFEAKGGVVVATTAAGADPLKTFAASQRDAGVVAREISTAEALDLEPALNPAITAAIHYPEDAQVQPVIAAEAMLRSARSAGAVMRMRTTVTGGIVRAGTLTGIHTDHGDLHGDVIVNAAGPWAAGLSTALGARIDVRPRRGMVLVTTRMPHRVFHKVYDGDYFGATQSADAALQTSSVIESTQGGTVLIGSSREQVGFDDHLRVEVLRELAGKAMRVFPFLANASIMRTYGGFRPYVPDHLPVIGPDPRMPGLWHATGHEGAGIGLSVSTADIITALIDGHPTPVDATPFRVDRAAVLGEEAA